MGLIDGASGGGGFLGGLGQMLDPLGLFKQGGGDEGGKAGGGDSLQKMFDPLGIFPALQGEVDKAMHKDASEGDADIKARAEKAMEAAGLVNNVADAWKSVGADESKGAKPSDVPTDEAHTDVVPNPDVTKAADGYADDQPKADDTSKTDDGLVKSQSASTATDAKPMDEYERKYINQLISDFTGLERETFDATDGVAYFHNLDSASNDSRQSQVMREAAKWLVDHDEARNLIVQLSGRSDGGITLQGLQAYRDLRQAQSQQPEPQQQNAPPKQDAPPASNTPPAGGGASGKIGGNANVDAQFANGNKALENLAKQHGKKDLTTKTTSGATDANTTNGANPYVYTPPKTTQPFGKTTSFEVGLKNLSDKLGSLEDRMNQLTDISINGSPEDSRKAQAELAMLTRQFDQISKMRQQMFDLLTNLQKSFHEMSMSAIRNMR